jgi:hypothetical protein
MARASRRPRLDIWVGIVAVGVVVTLISLAIRGDAGLQTAANWAQVVSLALSLPSFIQVVRLSRRSAPAVPTPLVTAETILADVVVRQWVAEARRRRLDHPDPIPVRWQITGDMHTMDRVENITSGSLLTLAANSANIAAIVTQFRSLRRSRLVILGDGGTGKTTLAVQLVLQLLETRGPADPVPILLTLTDWDPEAELLGDWIADRLLRDYPQLDRTELGDDVARHLVSRGRVLPVIDGVDELPAPSRSALIAHLNSPQSTMDQFVLTSRTAEFIAAIREADDVLGSALVLEPEPMSGQDAVGYLRRCLPPATLPVWEEVLAALPATPALRDTTSTALGLWLVREVYATPRREPAPLLGFPDSSALRAHLYDHLIPAVISNRPPSPRRGDLFLPRRRRDPAQVHASLAYLARLLAHEDPCAPAERELAWWELARRSGALSWRLGAAIAGLLGLLTGIAGELMFHDIRVGAGGMVVGCVAGAWLWWVARAWAHEQPGYAQLRLRSQYREFLFEAYLTMNRLFPPEVVRKAAAAGTGVAVVMTSSVVVVVGPHSDSSRGNVLAADVPVIPFPWDVVWNLAVVFAVVTASAALLATALTLIGWTAKTAGSADANSPQRSWRADQTLTAVRSAVLGAASALVAGSTIGVAFGMFTDPATGVLVGGFAAGAAGIIGMVVAIVGGAHHAWLAYLIAITILALRGELPLRLLAFLDDAHRLGLLRNVGPIYQFRHADLQDHLARSPSPAADAALPTPATRMTTSRNRI